MSADGDVSFNELTTREKLILLLTPNKEAAKQFAELLRNPVGFVVTVIVAQILGLLQYIVGSILAVGDIIAGSLGIAEFRLLQPLIAFQRGAVALLGDFAAAVAGLSAQAGPLGPPLIVGIGAVVAYLVWTFGSRLAVGLIGEAPGGSTVLSLLGLD